MLLSACGAIAAASTITLDTGKSTQGPLTSAAAYKSVVEAAVAKPTSGYGHMSIATFDKISNHTLFGTNSDIAFDFTINFGVAAGQTGNWDFRAGIDFGRGGAVFLDGVALGYKNTDMWWNGSYANPNQFFQYNAMVGAGNHVLKIYGLEGCCDGLTQAQFRAANSQTFTTFSSTDGLNFQVPEPTSFGLIFLGLLAVMSMYQFAQPGSNLRKIKSQLQ